MFKWNFFYFIFPSPPFKAMKYVLSNVLNFLPFEKGEKDFKRLICEFRILRLFHVSFSFAPFTLLNNVTYKIIRFKSRKIESVLRFKSLNDFLFPANTPPTHSPSVVKYYISHGNSHSLIYTPFLVVHGRWLLIRREVWEIWKNDEEHRVKLETIPSISIFMHSAINQQLPFEWFIMGILRFYGCSTASA